jgi:cell division control protein 6
MSNIIKDSEVLEDNYLPKADELLVREQAKDIQLVLDNFTLWQSNLLIYGYSGSGKTCSVRNLITEKEKTLSKATEKIAYVNLKKTFSELTAITEILNEIGIIMTAKTLFEYYKTLEQYIKLYNLKVLVVLDEIDKILTNESGDNLFFNLLESGVSIIAITNEPLSWEQNIEPKTKSRFGIKQSFFGSYGIKEIEEILRKRAEKAFYPNSMEEGVIEYISAICVQQNIDLRQAINMLKISAETANRKKTKIKTEYIEESLKKSTDLAEKELITTLNHQPKMVIEAMLLLFEEGKIEYRMNEIHEKYCAIAESQRIRAVTQSRMNDFVWSLEKLGIINSKRLSRSRGREKIITFKMPPQAILRVLKEEAEKKEAEEKKKDMEEAISYLESLRGKA